MSGPLTECGRMEVENVVCDSIARLPSRCALGARYLGGVAALRRVVKKKKKRFFLVMMLFRLLVEDAIAGNNATGGALWDYLPVSNR